MNPFDENKNASIALEVKEKVLKNTYWTASDGHLLCREETGVLVAGE
jgi:hypothetical protein